MASGIGKSIKPQTQRSTDTSPPFRDYQAEDDHRTLQRAEEIKGDGSRLSGAKKFHKKQLRGLTALGKSFGGKR